ncbi:hypothetical protein HK096_004914, partial [Nowakowskiella sp. JEL0078]
MSSFQNDGTRSTPHTYGHVDYILVAEFDIDKGSNLTYQYPSPTLQDTQFVTKCFYVAPLT